MCICIWVVWSPTLMDLNPFWQTVIVANKISYRDGPPWQYRSQENTIKNEKKTGTEIYVKSATWNFSFNVDGWKIISSWVKSNKNSCWNANSVCLNVDVLDVDDELPRLWTVHLCRSLCASLYYSTLPSSCRRYSSTSTPWEVCFLTLMKIVCYQEITGWFLLKKYPSSLFVGGHSENFFLIENRGAKGSYGIFRENSFT